jgi:hypothetical protein
MAYHSFPWCGDAWVALDILTPSPKREVPKYCFPSNSFRLFSTYVLQYNVFRTYELLFQIRFTRPDGRSTNMTKEQYIALINQLLERCADLDTLDLAYRILAKNI